MNNEPTEEEITKAMLILQMDERVEAVRKIINDEAARAVEEERIKLKERLEDYVSGGPETLDQIIDSLTPPQA